MTTLTKGSDVLTLTDDLIWTDEFEFNPVASSAAYGVDGALFIDEASRLSGQPITLAGGSNYGQITRAQLETLEAWKALPGQLFTLNYRGVNHSVVMDHARSAITATPRRERRSYVASDLYIATLRFLKV